MLRLLLELREELGVVLSVVHFNHKLRGKASDKDEAFVGQLAEKFGLTLHTGHGDVAGKAKREKANLEDAARRARYEFFRRATENESVDCVATAHTADDQAETVLAHILRGTGLAGLGGIHPKTSDGIVRPLLDVRRDELRKYLRAKKQKWREDASNQDTSRQRARMRKKLLPLLEKDFNIAVVEHLCGLSELAREDEALFGAMTQNSFEALAKRENNTVKLSANAIRAPFSWPASEAAQIALGRRLIRAAFSLHQKKAGQLTAKHVETVRRLAHTGENGKLLQLPGGVDVRRDDDWLVFLPREAKSKSRARAKEFAYPVDLRSEGSSVAVVELGCVFRLRSIDWPAGQRETKEDVKFALDADKLRGRLVLRSLRPGDRMRPLGHGAAHKLKRLLNEQRISRWEREGWPVLECGQNIVWARGFAAAEFAATHGTRRAILIVEERA